MRGIVKWYNEEKGFGFITPHEGGKDIFVHTSALRAARISSLDEGQIVEFDVTPGKKGPQASNVRLS